MTYEQIYDLKQNAILKKKTEMAILVEAQYVVGSPSLWPYAVSGDGKSLIGGNGTYSVSELAFARQAVAHPENFVPAFMGYVVMNATVQANAADESLTADSVIIGIVGANKATVWK